MSITKSAICSLAFALVACGDGGASDDKMQDYAADAGSDAAYEAIIEGGFENRISELEQQIANQESQISDLEIQVAEAQSEAEEAKSAVADLEARLY